MKPLVQLAALWLTLVTSPFAVAETPDDALARFQEGMRDAQTLAGVLPMLADPAQRTTIREALTGEDEPPRVELVALLDHPMLAVRLGALEILEELSGGDYGYNPWAPSGSPENTAALGHWTTWADEPAEPREESGIFSEEQRRAYLRDILAEDSDKSARARRMLEADGLPSVGFLEEFLRENPALGAGHRTRVREAQYQIVLSRQLGDQAATCARHLAFGSRDQVLAALATVRAVGVLALPILRDFISHPDPLIRESAIDSLLVTGGDQAVDIVAPLLRQESDVNVIHGALRRLKDVSGPQVKELVASFLDHPNEDLVVSAIQTSLSLSGDTEDSYSFSGRQRKSAEQPADGPVMKALGDERWRVRATALEYIAKRRLAEAKAPCLALLQDPDDFVRFAAITAVSSLGAKDALPELKAMLLADEAMAGPVISGYAELSQPPDAEMLAFLDSASPEARLAALRAAESSETLKPLVLHYCTDENMDVACAALRLLAASEDSVKRNRTATALLKALRSGEVAKIRAVIERLNLPDAENVDPRVLAALEAGLGTAEPTALDPLYEAFLKPGADAPGPLKQPEDIPGAPAQLIRELEKLITPETESDIRFNAALNLAKAGHDSGFQTLIRDLPALSTADKTTITDRIFGPATPGALALLGKLLRDPVSEVRQGAAECALSSDSTRVFVKLVFDELGRPDTPLQPHEIYSYRFESAVRSGGTSPHGAAILADKNSDIPRAVLAALALRNNSTTGANIEALRNAGASDKPLIRRAAWNALLSARPNELDRVADTIAADDHALVRQVLTSALIPGERSWKHHFSDLHVLQDSRWVYNERRPRVGENARAILGKLAATDPSPLVRFEAAFALLSHGGKINIEDFAASTLAAPTEADARKRVTNWLGENAGRATPALRPLLAVMDQSALRPAQIKLLNARVNPSTGEGFATFAALAGAAGQTANAEGGFLTEEENAGETPAERESLTVVYFYKPGCPECIRAKQYLSALAADFPLLDIREHNLLETSGTLLNQALCGRFSVPSARHTVSPAIFTQAGFLIREEISPPALAGLFATTMGLEQDDSWLDIGEEEKIAASEAVDRRYAAFTLPIVIGAGLLDGINPCAFATIIFFLSYLQIARRTPREMLMVGAAFISAVFIAYLAAGLVLYQSLAALNDRFAGIQKWMNTGFASLALVAAGLSFRDAWRARGGRLDEMTLQLPAFLKTRIRGVIRTTSKARNFVIGAFIAGLIISLLELACTGQVYAPIIYQIQQGKLDAVLWLVVYNLAFITPLVVIFLLAYGGLRSENLIAFQKKHTSAVKIGLGLLFVVLAVFILFGQRWIGPL